MFSHGANHRCLVTVREFFYAVAQGCSHAPAANVPFTADLQRTGDDTLFGKTQSPQRTAEGCHAIGSVMQVSGHRFQAKVTTSIPLR